MGLSDITLHSVVCFSLITVQNQVRTLALHWSLLAGSVLLARSYLVLCTYRRDKHSVIFHEVNIEQLN